MQPVDWIIIAIIGLSALLSLLRGFTRELFSLLAWVAAIVGARLFAPSLAVLFGDVFAGQEMRELVAFAALFVLILMTGMLLSWLAGEAVQSSSLSVGDRLLGTGFGFVRGVIIVLVVLTFSARWLSGETFWRESRLIPHFMVFEGWTRAAADKSAGWISTHGQQ